MHNDYGIIKKVIAALEILYAAKRVAYHAAV